jgi:hypothetical protein
MKAWGAWPARSAYDEARRRKTAAKSKESSSSTLGWMSSASQILPSVLVLVGWPASIEQMVVALMPAFSARAFWRISRACRITTKRRPVSIVLAGILYH